MVLFGLLNYEDYILRTIVTSTYARNALTVLVMYLITGIIRFHLSVILCWLCTVDNIINLFIPIVINVILALLSDTLYQYVGTHRPIYERLVDYFMTNYSRKNMIRWKRFILIGIFTYILIVLALVDVDNMFLLISTLQTVASFIICDLLEHRRPIYHRIERFYNKPRINKLSKDFTIINDYKIIPIEPALENGAPLYRNSTDFSSCHENLEHSLNHKRINNDLQTSTISCPTIKFPINIKPVSSPILMREISNGRISPPIPEKPPTPPRISTPLILTRRNIMTDTM